MNDNPLINQVVLLLVAAIPGTLLAWFGHRRNISSDKIATQAAIVSAERENHGQLIDGLNSHIDRLLLDNKEGREQLREQVKECAIRMEVQVAELIKTRVERDAAVLRVQQLELELRSKSK